MQRSPGFPVEGHLEHFAMVSSLNRGGVSLHSDWVTIFYNVIVFLSIGESYFFSRDSVIIKTALLINKIMFNIHLVVLGKLKENYWRDAEAEYLKRLSIFAKLEIHELREESFSEKDNPETVKEKEIGRAHV